MTTHLADNHPDWEFTATTDTREVLTAKIKLAEGEEERLKAEMPSGHATAAKRPAMSPPTLCVTIPRTRAPAAVNARLRLLALASGLVLLIGSSYLYFAPSAGAGLPKSDLSLSRSDLTRLLIATVPSSISPSVTSAAAAALIFLDHLPCPLFRTSPRCTLIHLVQTQTRMRSSCAIAAWPAKLSHLRKTKTGQLLVGVRGADPGDPVYHHLTSTRPVGGDVDGLEEKGSRWSGEMRVPSQTARRSTSSRTSVLNMSSSTTTSFPMSPPTTPDSVCARTYSTAACTGAYLVGL
ncbi:hypothetical protein DFH08DRAFT_1081304 [Mycena albidolilacea]|uniref:Uncharacterized protein n=1 Tax=Mycena albidolilacea TaxID=1033008 RepID=A0AAD7EQ49_9AGAR|nr:hypothetical protein DFH08DRAFT_1081304 [Mycena albidolilacea]